MKLAILAVPALMLAANVGITMSAPESQPAHRPAAAPDPKAAERTKWEDRIVFYTEEDASRYSIRILDNAAKEAASFTYLELWKYEVTEKHWQKVDDQKQTKNIVLPEDKPADAPAKSQLLAEIPVAQDDLGLYYAKFQVNGVDAGIMTRVGPSATGKTTLGKCPAGMMVADVPIDKLHAERMFVPDPRTNTK